MLKMAENGGLKGPKMAYYAIFTTIFAKSVATLLLNVEKVLFFICLNGSGVTLEEKKKHNIFFFPFFATFREESLFSNGGFSSL